LPAKGAVFEEMPHLGQIFSIGGYWGGGVFIKIYEIITVRR